MLEIWYLWLPNAGATGVPFCRSRVDSDAAGDRLLVHAAPPTLEVTLRSAQDGRELARGDDLTPGEPGPMSYLMRDGDRITLEGGWPTDETSADLSCFQAARQPVVKGVFLSKSLSGARLAFGTGQPSLGPRARPTRGD